MFAGVAFDESVSLHNRSTIDSTIQEVVREAHRVAGMEFLLASPAQVSDVLFNKLKLPSVC